LQVLAGFDQAAHLTGTGAKKLHIHDDGRFTVDEGRGAAFRRSFTRHASLTDNHYRHSIENLFTEATNLLVLNGPFENGLRVEIFSPDYSSPHGTIRLLLRLTVCIHDS